MMKQNARVTVFTSAYNRAHTLERLYQSLKNQTSKDFIWMIIDDGSIDDTELIVRKFIDNTSDFEISYYKKENEGMHSCWNVAALNCTTELMLNCDSDDWLVDNAIEVVLREWDVESDKSKYAGLIGLMKFESGKIIGTCFPKVKSINVIDWSIGKYPNVVGDKAIVLRTELMRAAAPMQVFYGEKNFNPMYMIRKACGDLELLVVNQCISFVEYQQDGMSAGMYKQYYNSPNSWCEYRKQLLRYGHSSIKYKMRQMIHYQSSCIFAHKKLKERILGVNYPGLAIICMPLGGLLNIWVRYNLIRGTKMKLPE